MSPRLVITTEWAECRELEFRHTCCHSVSITLIQLCLVENVQAVLDAFHLKGAVLAAVSSTKWASFYNDQTTGLEGGEDGPEEDDEVTSTGEGKI
ncbi:unnamed protein product [Protopolystoma xenopodis]|uniref:Uncharacterized protein n=1 Tax=Protopolystoma xenopodis TaxID=117903 RepID=A0A3S5FC41_9PLAT|nr:unnamed protein product [Protopolystoma xenopodis]